MTTVGYGDITPVSIGKLEKKINFWRYLKNFNILKV
jgi:hypothetical protein